MVARVWLNPVDDLVGVAYFSLGQDRSSTPQAILLHDRYLSDERGRQGYVTGSYLVDIDEALFIDRRYRGFRVRTF